MGINQYFLIDLENYIGLLLDILPGLEQKATSQKTFQTAPLKEVAEDP